MPEAAVPPPAGAVQISQPKPTDPPLEPSPPSGKTADQAFDEQVLDELDKPAPPAAAAIPAAAKPAESGKPAAQAPPAKPAEPTGDEDKEPTSGKPSDFRKWGQRQASKAQKFASEVSQLKARLAQLETAGPKDGQDALALAQELARVKKANEEYENELRLVRYERSHEYRDGFEKKAQEAAQRAYQEVKELTVYEPNPDDPDNPRERPALPADFDEIYGLTTGAAIKLAKQKFGDAFFTVIEHRKAVREAWKSAYAAVEEYKGKAVEVEQAQMTMSKQQEIVRNGAWQKLNDTFIQKNPEMFGLRDGDEEGNTLLVKAANFLDTVFSKDRNNYSEQQRWAMDARARNWALAFPRLNRDVKKLKADLAEANKTIETLRGSSPGKPAPGTEPMQEKAGTWEDDFDKKVPA